MDEVQSLKVFQNLRWLRFLVSNASIVPNLLEIYAKFQSAATFAEKGDALCDAIRLIAPLLDTFPTEETLLANPEAVAQEVENLELKFGNGQLFRWLLEHQDEIGSFIMLLVGLFGKG